jgi:hypothetical protein
MRTKRTSNATIDALFPPTRQQILATVLLQPHRSWYLSDLAVHLGRRNPSSLQRELESLVAGEILHRRQEGNRVYFQANRDCPVYMDLVGLLSKTVGLADVVGAALVPIAERIDVAFIHGSVARSEQHATSDIDLLVIGDVGLSQLSPALRAAEQQLGRSIGASVYSPVEFAGKVAAGHHFLNSVLAREKIFLIGNENVLEELARRQSSAASRDDSARAG